MKFRHWERLSGKGLNFSELGFGGAPLGNLFRAIDEIEARATLDATWEAGCRYFDTAPRYGLGLSETRLNGFLRGKARDSYIISTKVGRLLTLCPPEERSTDGSFIDVPLRREDFDYSRDGILRSLEFSLERLGLDRIDILYLHDLDLYTHKTEAALAAGRDQFLASGLKTLVELRDQGVISAFGAGINEWESAQWLAERGDFDLFLLAGRYTLLEQEALETFLPLCLERNIGIALGGPYNSGILATGPVEGAYFNYEAAPAEVLEKVKRIQDHCQDHGVRLIEAALQFPLHHPSVVSVIPGGQSAEQARTNHAILEKEIPAELWQSLKAAGLMREDAPTP